MAFKGPTASTPKPGFNEIVVTTGPNSLSKSDEYRYQPLSIETLNINSASWPTTGCAGDNVQDHFAGVIFCPKS